MKKSTVNGLFALGLAAAAAWWKMTPEQRSNVKNKVAGAGTKLKDGLNNLKSQVQQKTQSAS